MRSALRERSVHVHSGRRLQQRTYTKLSSLSRSLCSRRMPLRPFCSCSQSPISLKQIASKLTLPMRTIGHSRQGVAEGRLRTVA